MKKFLCVLLIVCCFSLQAMEKQGSEERMGSSWSDWVEVSDQQQGPPEVPMVEFVNHGMPLDASLDDDGNENDSKLDTQSLVEAIIEQTETMKKQNNEKIALYSKISSFFELPKNKKFQCTVALGTGICVTSFMIFALYKRYIK